MATQNWIKDSLKNSIDAINGTQSFDGHLTTQQTKDLLYNLNATSLLLTRQIGIFKDMIKRLEDQQKSVDRHARGLKNSLYGE